MATNKAKLDMPNGAHEQPGAGTSIEGQELFYSEIPVEGDAWWMTNDMEHRDAAFEEILHMVHDTGIGVDGANSRSGALPDFQKEIRAATNLNKPTYLGGNGLWAESDREWVEELAQENSLSQEYFASVIDVYYGLWGFFAEGGMWGLYGPDNREQLVEMDPAGYALATQFFSPYLTWMAMLSPTLNGTFTMSFDESLPYTWKSQYYLHATLLGSNNSNLVGNDQDNCLGPNAGTNQIDGKAGTDVVMFRGLCAEYSIDCHQSEEMSSGSCTMVDSVSNRDGTTTSTNVEILSFVDADYDKSNKACKMKNSFSAASQSCWKLVVASTDEGASTTSDDSSSAAPRSASSFWAGATIWRLSGVMISSVLL